MDNINNGKVKSLYELDEYLDKYSQTDLQLWLPSVNMFEILKVDRAEIRHSNFLGWLLDPNGKHLLGDAFVNYILEEFLDDEEKPAVKNGFSDVKVIRESEKDIDILVTSPENKFNLIIENKIWTKDHDKQLVKYGTHIQNKFSDYTNKYVYLTPYGEKPTQDTMLENGQEITWELMSYKTIYKIVEKLYVELPVDSKVKFLLQDYNENVRHNIMADEARLKQIKKIYKEHKDALNLIFDEKEQYVKGFVSSLNDKLNQNDEIKKLVTPRYYDDEGKNFRIGFTTKKMDNLVGEYGDGNTKHEKLNERSMKYAYEIAFDQNVENITVWLTVGEPEKRHSDDITQRLKRAGISLDKFDPKWNGITYHKFNSENTRPTINPEESFLTGDKDAITDFLENVVSDIVEFEETLSNNDY